MADQRDDKKIGLHSSVLTLGKSAYKIVSLSYGMSCTLLAIAAFTSNIHWLFWPFLALASFGMQREIVLLMKPKVQTSTFGRHFKNQVWLGSLILLGLIIGRIS